MKCRELMPPFAYTRWIVTAAFLAFFGLVGFLLMRMSVARVAELGPANDPNGRVDWWADVQGGATVVTVAALPESAWTAYDGGPYLGTQGPGVLWLRVVLHNPTAETHTTVLADLEYFTDRVECWERNDAATGGWRVREAGEGLAAVRRAGVIAARVAAFPVTIGPGETRSLLVRAEDVFNLFVRPRWWTSAEDFHSRQQAELLFEALCYGGLVALVLYNLVLWVRLGYADTGYYVLYVTAVAVFNFTANGGWAVAGLRVDSPGKEVMLTALLALGALFQARFGREMLGVTGRGRLARLMDVWQLGLVLLVLAAPVLWWRPWQALPTAGLIALQISTVGMLVVGVRAWWNGFAPARFFVAAFVLYFVAAAPALWTWWTGDVTAWAARLYLFGTEVEMVCLSLAVADRFTRTQRELVAALEDRRVIEAAYADELEIEVRERTHELELANDDKDRILTIVGHDLRGPLTGLMRRADREQSAFAAEASLTSRSLLLLIEDLVLWARLGASQRRMGTHAAQAVLAPAVALHRSVANQDGVQLLLEVPDGLSVRTDLTLAQTLVRNLLANALKFARSRVILSASVQADGSVRIAVDNDGPGLDEAVALRLSGGSDLPLTATGGLGLRLCREICAVLGNSLVAGPGRAGGTEFAIVLDAGKEEERV